MKKSKVQQLVELIEEEFGIKLNADSFQRTRSGHRQRSIGAWSWTMQSNSSSHDFGSQDSVTKLLENKNSIMMYGSFEFMY